MARPSSRLGTRPNRSARFYVLVGLVVAAAIVGLALLNQQQAAPSILGPRTQTTGGVSYEPLADSLKTATLRDARTGQSLRISDFSGKVVVVELMAIWCPLCVDQGDQIAAVVQQMGDRVIFVSIDVDPNENAALLGRYADQLNRRWTFAYDESGAFHGALIRNVQRDIPETPVYIISLDGSGIFTTRPGVKPASEIRQLLERALA